MENFFIAATAAKVVPCLWAIHHALLALVVGA